MSDSHIILRQTSVHLIGRFASVLLGVAVLGITTRLLGPALFGVYGTALAYLQLFGILMDFGLTVTTLDVLARATPVAQKRIIGSLITLRFLLSVVVTAGAFVILEAFPYPAMTRHAIYLASLLFIFYSFQQLFTSVFQFTQNTLPIVLSELAGRVATLLGLGMVAAVSGGVLGVIGAGIAGNFIVVLLLALWSRRAIAWVASTDHAQWKEILSKSWPIGLSIAFNLIYFKADTIILSFLQSPEIVGLYSAPYKILEVLISFPPLFLGLVLPQWSAAVAAKDDKEFSHWLGWALDLTALIVIPMVLGTIAIATDLMRFVAGAAFSASGPILQILIIATGIIFFANVFGYAIVATGEQKKMIPWYATAAIASLFIYWKAILWIGMAGAAWTTVGVELFIFLCAVSVLYRRKKFSVRIQNLTKYIISGVIMFFILLLVHNVIHILLSVLLGSIMYMSVLWPLGGLNIVNIKEIRVLQHQQPHG